MKYDVAIIGGGPAGYTAAERAAQGGLSTILFEKNALGGVCLNEGCVPTKTLLYSAKTYDNIKHASKYAVKAENPSFDLPKIIARKNKVVKKLTAGIRMKMTEHGVVMVTAEACIQGRATDGTITIAAGEELYEAANLLICTGSETVIPPIPGLAETEYWTSREALQSKELPASLVIIGGGVIGMEFACLYATLGVDVTVVEMMPAILPPADEEMGAIVRKRMEALGVKIHTSCKVTGFDSVSGGVMTHVLDPQGRELQFSSDKVLLSIGRRADTAALNLDAAGVKAERGRIAVNKKMETSVRNIYAIGDCCSPIMLAHVASAEGEVAAENIMGASCDMDYKTVPSCVYTLPEMAWVGMTEKAAVETGRKIKVGRFPLIGNGKSLIMNETDGMVKIIADEKYGEILGVHIVGPHATDLIVEGALALRLEATADEIISTVHAHPTVGEALAEATLDLQGRAIHLPPQA